jgi:gliding motility-associated-like protein
MLKKIIISACIGLTAFSVQGQIGNPAIDINFNNCQIDDDGSSSVVLETGGSPLCECGLEGDALYLDGNQDYLSIAEDLSSLFGNDFTLSFYLKIENDPSLSMAVDILSLQKECKRDSSLTLKYIPSIRECRLDIVKSLARNTQINFTLDEGKCWQHIVIVRDYFTYYVYLNGRLAGSELAQTDYVFSPDARFSVANSPCLGLSDIRFEGYIEELQIYNRALNEVEINGLDLYPDQILNQDTTLLLGESLEISTGPNCADAFYWNNTNDFNDPALLNPIITPQESGTYYLFFQNAACTSYDSISIYIQDPNALECGQLLLPNAFTPNNDNLNDILEISNKFIVEEILSFDIYNRSGSRVFHGDSKQSAWDGNYQGKALNPGKFAYVIEYLCDGEKYRKTGIVTLIR